MLQRVVGVVTEGTGRLGMGGHRAQGKQGESGDSAEVLHDQNPVLQINIQITGPGTPLSRKLPVSTCVDEWQLNVSLIDGSDCI